MKIDPIEIVDAWAAKYFTKPDSARDKLAKERLAICNECEFKKSKTLAGGFEYTYCGGCGCVLSAKVFSKKENICPKKKWTCDYKSPFFNKEKKSLV